MTFRRVFYTTATDAIILTLDVLNKIDYVTHITQIPPRSPFPIQYFAKMSGGFKGALIDGGWTKGDELASISVLDPSNGQAIGQISGKLVKYITFTQKTKESDKAPSRVKKMQLITHSKIPSSRGWILSYQTTKLKDLCQLTLTLRMSGVHRKLEDSKQLT